MLKLLGSFLLLLALLTAPAYAQGSGVCRVSANWWNLKARVGSGYMILGEFSLPARGESVTRHYKYYDTGLIVSVGVKYIYRENTSKPDAIELAVKASEQEATEMFDTPNNALAGIPYRKGWHSWVRQNVTHEDLLHTFSLFCGEAKPKRK